MTNMRTFRNTSPQRWGRAVIRDSRCHLRLYWLGPVFIQINVR